MSDSVRLGMRLGDDHEIRRKHEIAQHEFIRIEQQQRSEPGVLDHADVTAFTTALTDYTRACATLLGVDVRQAPG